MTLTPTFETIASAGDVEWASGASMARGSS